MAFLGIMQLSFLDEENHQTIDFKTLRSHCAKIKQRFKVEVIPCSKAYTASISLAMLSQNENAIKNTFDRISRFSEECGFARVDQSTTLIDHVESIFSNELEMA